jgi:hypothetical protein
MVGDPRDSKHFMCNPVEKAKNENPKLRYEDAGALLAGIEKAIEYNQNAELKENINEKISNGVYDEDIESYIYSLNSQELCKSIIEVRGMVLVINEFVEFDDRRVVKVLQMLQNDYLDVCKTWSDYDNFGRVAYNVIHKNLAYVAQEIAARILAEVAYGKNRYKIQELVIKLIKKGVDPLIEEILNNN